MLTDAQVQACLARIGLPGPQAPSLQWLRELQVQHLKNVPFENLSFHLGEPIAFEPDTLLEKIVTGRRGGFCYEMNGLFAALLRTLGFEVDLLAGTDGGSRPFDHLALGVRLPGEPPPWLADVGFGRLSAYPIPWVLDSEIDDPVGRLRLTPTDSGDLEVSRGGKADEVLAAYEKWGGVILDRIPVLKVAI